MAFSNSHAPTTVIYRGQLLSDGTTLDLLRDPMNDRITLVRWNGASLEMGEELPINGKLYRAPSDEPFCSSLYWPTHANVDCDIGALHQSIKEALMDTRLVDQTSADLLAYYARASWFVDVLPVMPNLSLAGGRRACESVLRVLACACRHPLYLSFCDQRTLKAVDMRFQPTLLLAFFNGGREGPELLRSSDTAGASYLNSKRFIDVPIMKVVINAEYTLARSEISSNWIRVVTLPGARPTAMRAGELAEFRNLVQPGLAGHRLRTIRSVSDRMGKQANDSEGEPRSEVLCAITGCVTDHEASPILGELLRPQRLEDEFASDTLVRNIVVEALLAHLHDKETAGTVLIGNLANSVNAILASRGETFEMTPRAVGAELKKLGFATARHGKAGRGIALDRNTSIAAHELSERFNTLTHRSGLVGCSLCGKGGERGERNER